LSMKYLGDGKRKLLKGKTGRKKRRPAFSEA